MNKFAKALLLALVFAAPVAMSIPAVQAKPATAQNRVALSTSSKTVAKHTKAQFRAKHSKKHAARRTTNNMALKK